MTQTYRNNREQYSSIIENVSRNVSGWRLCTMIALLVAITAVGGVVYMAAQSEIKPVLVVMNADHQPVGVYQPGTGLDVRDERVTKASLAQFVNVWRTVSIDTTWQRRRVNELEKYIRDGSPAFVKIKDYIVSPATNPLRRGETETVSIRITAVLPVSGNTWQIDWLETVTRKQSGQSASSRYQATITFTFMDDVPAEILLTNPTGLLISDINWSESIQ